MIPVGTFQVEIGTTFVRDEFADVVSARVLTAPSVLLRAGITDWMELRGLGEVSREDLKYSNEAANFFRDTFATTIPLGVGAKFQLLDEDGPIPETALITHFLFPDPFKSVVPEFVFTMSHSLTSTIGIGYNLGAEWNLEREHLEPFYTIALGTDFTDDIGGYVEIFGGWDPDSDAEHSFDAGLTILARNNAQLDVSGGIGLTESAPDYFMGAGFSVRFPR